MDKTEQFELPLWSLSDRILMKDFNEGNRKIDSAISAVRTEVRETAAAIRAETSQTDQAIRAETSSMDQSLRAETTQTAQAIRAEVAQLAQAIRGETAQLAQAIRGELSTGLASVRQEIVFKKLVSVTSGGAGSSLRLNLQGVDISNCHFLQLYMNCPLVDQPLYLRVNGLTEGYQYMGMGGSGGGSWPNQAHFMAAYAPYGGPAAFQIHFNQIVKDCKVGGICFCGSGGNFATYQALAPCKWGEVSSFDLSGSSGVSLPAGTSMVLYGVGKL